MERANFYNDQDVMADDLNAIENSILKQTSSRSVAPLGSSGGVNSGTGGSVTLGGIYGSPADYLTTTKNFYCSKLGGTSISVATGKALDVNGNLILISAAKTVTLNDNTATAVWTEITAGTKYIKLSYLEASGSVQSDDLGVQFYTRYTDSYRILISAASASANEIYLGSFTADGVGFISDSIVDMRQYCRIITPASAVILDPLKEPAKTIGWTSVEDHVNAIGHSTPSASNPHGTSASDIGFSTVDITNHWRDAHVNGIMLLARDTTTLQSWSGSVVSPTSSAYINFNPPTAYAAINNGGTLFSGSIAPLLGTEAPADGTYWVVFDGTSVAKFKSTGSVTFDISDPHLNPNYTRLGLAVVSDSGDNIDSYVNMRDVFAMSQYDVRGDTTEGKSSPLITLSDTATLIDNLNRVRYQLGLIVDGNSSHWNSLPSASVYQAMKSVHLYGKYDDAGTSAGDELFAKTWVENDNAVYKNKVGGRFYYRKEMQRIRADYQFRTSVGTGEVGTVMLCVGTEIGSWIGSYTDTTTSSTFADGFIDLNLLALGLTEGSTYAWALGITNSVGGALGPQTELRHVVVALSS